MTLNPIFQGELEFYVKGASSTTLEYEGQVERWITNAHQNSVTLSQRQMDVFLDWMIDVFYSSHDQLRSYPQITVKLKGPEDFFSKGSSIS